MRTRAQWNIATDAAVAPFSLSTSNVANWKLYRDTTVTTAMDIESIVTTFKSDIDNALATKQAGSLGWIAMIAKAFQYGDSLIVTDGVIGYPVIDPVKQIIAQAAAIELDEEVLAVKVAKASGATFVMLTTPELTAFKNYMKARRWPGVKMNIVSLPSDELTYTFDALFNPAYDEVALTLAVQAAIASFQANFGYNALFYREQFRLAVMEVPGIIDVSGLTLSFVLDGGTSGVSDVIDYIELPAGYFTIDGASVFSLQPAP